MRKFRVIFSAVVLFVSLTVLPAAEPSPFILPQTDHRTTVRLMFDPPDTLPNQLHAPDRAHAFLTANKARFGLSVAPADLKRVRVKKSLTATHVYYEQYLNDIPVEGGVIVVSIDLQTERVRRVYNNTYPVKNPVAPPRGQRTEEQALDLAWNHLRVHGDLEEWPEAKLMYSPEPNGFRLIYDIHLDVAAPVGFWGLRVDALSGKILSVRRRHISFKNGDEKIPVFAKYQGRIRSRADETARLQAERAAANEPPQPAGATVNGMGLVFDPNPVITLMNPGLLDTSPPATFDPAYFNRTLRDITETAGVYTLVGPWVRIATLGGAQTGPNTAPSTTTNGIWTAKRGTNDFNDAMTYFHVDQNQRYVQSLGFTGASGIQQAPIDVDTDAANGNDASFFKWPENRLLFGHGCVDDCEDADVILHEYGHALQRDIINDWGGADFGALGEGFADYWAGSYKSSTPEGATYYLNRIMTWDGHNASGCAWGGRRLDKTGLRYNPAVTYGTHQILAGGVSDELWSTPLFQTLLDLVALGRPREEVDRIILESHFGLGFGLSMPDLAQVTVDTAKRLHPSGPHADVFLRHFRFHHILPIPKPIVYSPSVGAEYAAGSDVAISWGTNGLPGGVMTEIEYATNCSPQAAPIYFDDMENGLNGWTINHGVGTVDWSQSNTDANSGTNSWYANDVASLSDQYLISPAWNIPPNAALGFWHRYSFEFDGLGDYDGGVIEISTNGVAGPWTDLGPAIVANGYNGTISGGYGSPIAGQDAFTQGTVGFVETIVDLTGYSGIVHIRFRLATDTSTPGGGWWVDDVGIYPSTWTPITWLPLVSVPVGATPHDWTTPATTGVQNCVRVRFSNSTNRASDWCEIGPFALVQDTDGDGIPDNWETPNGLNPLVNDAAADNDLDGFNNYDEYIMDTNPGNPADFLFIRDILNQSPPMISFSSSVNRVYDLDFTPSILTTDWHRVHMNIPGSNTVLSLPDPTAVNDGRGYYRVGVKLP